MIKTREELAKKINEISFSLILANGGHVTETTISDICTFAKNRFNVPLGVTNSCIYRRRGLDEFSNFVLFTTAFSIDHLRNTSIVKEFFTPKEIEEYQEEKYHVETVKEEIRIKCFPVTSGEASTATQWIGIADARFLLDLQKRGMINYNFDAQRVMKRVIRGNEERYEINLNQNAVRSIAEELKEGTFIPNTITLNIPMDEDGDVSVNYDGENNELVIKDLNHFDISDGYHRYQAMIKLNASDPLFNYPIELRILYFQDKEVRSFIFQEDKKTHMTKVDSASMDTGSNANVVVEKMISDKEFAYRQLIKRHDGIIDFAEFSAIINYFWNMSKRKFKIPELIKIKNDIAEELESLFDEGVIPLDQTLKFYELFTLMYCVKKKIDDPSIKRKETLKKYQTYIENILADQRFCKAFKTKTPRRALENILDSFQ